MAIGIIDRRLRFPDPHRADADGLVAIGGDLSVPRLLPGVSQRDFSLDGKPRHLVVA